MDSTFAFTPATEVRRMIAAKEISAVELAEFFFQRIEESEPAIERLPDRVSRAGFGRCQGGG